MLAQRLREWGCMTEVPGSSPASPAYFPDTLNSHTFILKIYKNKWTFKGVHTLYALKFIETNEHKACMKGYMSYVLLILKIMLKTS